ncbi:amino acid adenylation domain-containing protein [Streptomyces avidinii]|uniref:amino acid adenylation domain-containing protein n=1 Tax=Streptomyces avidinii TaxID=1895 RepID=UPI003864043B|nr:amino acid adenylation domain-containing protein [Streptomyces avidinii]
MTRAYSAQDGGFVDLADPMLHANGDPHAAWQWFRENAPVHWSVRHTGTAYWSVTTYAEASQVLCDGELFSSARGMRLEAEPEAVEAASGKLLIVTDAPRHGKIRRMIGSAFTARTVRRLEHNMQRTVAELLEKALMQEECDLTQVAARLPVAVICDLLGVPREDWEFMLEHTRVAFESMEENGKAGQDAIASHTEILLYYADLAEKRRRNPQDDVISALVHGTVDGKPLTDEEIYLNCDGLISGGNETTRHAIVGGVLAFAREPEQWRRLRAEPELIDSAVEEILRWTTPGTHILRTATRETELGGQRIEKGQSVVAWIPSANRDAQVFADADRFRLDRGVNRHLALGLGGHYCLGSALARAELRSFFAELARRVETVECVGPVRRVRSNHISGFEYAPVRLARTAGSGESKGDRAMTAKLPERCAYEFVADWVGVGGVALVGEGVEWSYEELDRRVGVLAGVLRGRGVGPEVRVGVCLGRGVDVVVAVLAVWRAGGVAVPLDPGYPVGRLGFMVDDAAPALVVTSGRWVDRLPVGCGVLLVEDVDWAGGVPFRGDAGVVPANAAYVVYTSGSTGRPKGVVVPHRGLGAVVTEQRRRFGIQVQDRVLSFSSPSFDAWIFELLLTFASGATLCTLPWPEPDLVRLAEHLRTTRVTAAMFPPAALSVLEGEDLPDLRIVMVTGEVCPPAVARRWAAERAFFNCYGPTETTIWAACHGPHRGQVGTSVPIGTPVAGTRVYVLDGEGRPVPRGVAGELCVGGTVVSRGYGGRPGLTAERFVPDPFATEPGARMYRTGDRAWWGEDGRLHFGGRLDRQVQIRGFRVEPAEVEHRLRALPGVDDAAVVAYGSAEETGGVRLAAFVVLAEPSSGRQEQLAAALAAELPAHMVPETIAPVDELPRAVNGKTDQEVLSAMAAQRTRTAGAASGQEDRPATDTERVLIEIWQEIFERDGLGVTADFFGMGGHSLLAARCAARIRARLAVELSPRAIYDTPVLRDQAAAIDNLGHTPVRTIRRASRARFVRD